MHAAAGAGAAAADGLALKRVMLSTGGVGYFEYEAEVAGDTALSLEVRLDQVDDVMKSIVVYDDRGGIGTISLPGREPLVEIFREMPFSPDDLTSPVDLLNALRGAVVHVAGTTAIEGRLLSVTQEAAQLPQNAGTITRNRVSLVTAEGLRQLILEDASAITLADPRLREQVNTALSALAEHGERDRRRLAIQTRGDGARTVRVAYVVAAPLWKSAYRLTLPGSGTDGELQGWAVLENRSGEDWGGVELTVVSGNPVTFRQALYDTYYVDRPAVPVEVLGRVLPRVDEGAMPAPVPQRQMAEKAAPRAMTRGLAMAPGMMAPAPSSPMEAFAADEASEVPPPPPARMADLTAAESSEATTQVVFRYPLPVTVANGQSLLMPIASRKVPAEPVALYQPETHRLHPLAAVRLTNDGASGLPPGILTLYERNAAGNGAVTYVGDARLGALPAGEERLLSFALDQKVRIDRRDSTNQRLTQATIIDGILQLVQTDRRVTDYAISGAAREPRTVLIEHPRPENWTLVSPEPATVTVTPTAFRLRTTVAAGATAALQVVLERPRQETYSLIDLDSHRIEAFVTATVLSPPIRKALGHLGDLRRDLAKRERTVGELERRRETISADQERLRQNLAAAPRESDLFRRYLTRLGDREDQIEKTDSELAKAREAVEDARKALSDYARSLSLS